MAFWSGLIAKPQRTPLTSRPSLTLFFLLVGAFLLTLVPQVVQFPPWLTVIIVGAMILRSFVELYRLPLPSSTFCGILAIILFGLVWVTFGTIMGRLAGTAVTAGLLAIKFYEVRQPRDIALIIFCCFFVVMSALLFSQVLELFVYCLIMMWVLTALLVRVQAGDRPEDRLLHMLGRSGLVFLQALPLALCLFFFFPRVNGPLGFSLSDPPIGLTNTVAPGSIAKLSKDDSLAMYVSFTSGSYPLAESMYWRAVVLYDYHNGIFTTGEISNFSKSWENDADPRKSYVPPQSGVHFDQTITAYANNQHWLYALDVPTMAPQSVGGESNWAGMYDGSTVRLISGKLDHVSRYIVSSSPFRPEEQIDKLEYRDSLELPKDTDPDAINPKVKALADDLFQKAGRNDEAYIFAVLRYFHHSGFIYSTDLPEQGKDWLAEFLLTRKTGYCEHFAAAFAVLMRLEKIPTRLVTGYLGGDLNPYTGEYAVPQSNAHAWDEVWQPTHPDPNPDPKNPKNELLGKWTRIDPTTMAASSDAAAPVSSGNPYTQSAIPLQKLAPSFADTYFPDWLKGGMKEMRLRREQMEMTWDNVILSYDTDTQLHLAQRLGFGVNPMFALLLVCVLASAACAIGFWRWLTHKPKVPPVEYLYAAFCRNMARRGVPRAEWEGPLAYTGRVAEAFPDDTPALRKVGDIVARARYGPVPADGETVVRLESALALISASQAAAASRERR
jgi:hypothetical protein